MPIESFQESQERKFEIPSGFTRVSELAPEEPGTAEAYRAQGLEVPERGTWNQNNGTIAIVDSEGRLAVWVTKPDPNAPRQVSYEKAVKSLEDAGYKKGNWYVPCSNNKWAA